MTVNDKNNIIGLRSGQLTVVAFSHRESRPGLTRLFWRCRCDCGSEKVLLGQKLREGKAKSCGSCEKPGGNRTDWPGYSSLKAALARCGNPKNRAYPDYGGRGIRVCDRWTHGDGVKTGFECFFEDIGPRPSPDHSIDRIETDGHYEPGNCRWSTKKVQQQNQRRAIYAMVGGVKVPLKKYVARTGLCYETIRFLVRKKGLTVNEASRQYMQGRA